MIKKIITWTIISIILIFLLAVFTNVIMSIEIFSNKVAGKVENWIGFYATVIAGILTLFGVLITIEFNKKQIENGIQKERHKEEEKLNLNKIKLLWDLEINLNGLNKDLSGLEIFIKNKIDSVDIAEYEALIDKRLKNEISLNDGQKEKIKQEIGREYVDEKFSEIISELNKLHLSYSERKLQIKSAEIDLETYGYTMVITQRISDICNTLKTITGPGSDELGVFCSESKLLLKKISGMSGISAIIEGVKHKINKKREEIESKYFSRTDEL
ncbi:hypothetical protein [Lysinibacillus fusiformis]|uniref:Uncharacterized protein n=1 Tax=Lysinibacillus fusiformis TaxID=28031 RepID=A0A1H9JL11_9BACI|nr:hypothetical protein [Lysinibacillus fusiformis]SCY42926.1 hypothetical protein SAMN02787081_02466 [Lysinibacillus fusiformis]SEN75360.1 hypothetical protein SAMN02787103_02541 [Lysinibacillus fusiformis]SEQ87526.1 hypothetical protein SAMN02787113_02554 [Lysinibacillus fusiformis]